MPELLSAIFCYSAKLGDTCGYRTIVVNPRCRSPIVVHDGFIAREGVLSDRFLERRVRQAARAVQLSNAITIRHRDYVTRQLREASNS